ncbi:NAD(P)H-hydrate dehydratase [Roseococcus sp. DSY-14]|uniref:NAD(P)H-hydrate dehydratase n=1 Tax=Roseococcus sp. DSY-14 TaxID=3369650 RepID=UPI00387AC64F
MTDVLDEAWLRANPLPPMEAATDKDSRGRVLLAGGCREVPGGILLAAEAALRAGAGKLQVATAAAVAPGLALRLPEARVVALPETAEGGIGPAAAPRLEELAARVDAVGFGPGMMDPEEAGALARALLRGVRRPVAFLLDAAAICGLEPDSIGRHGGRLVLTPHAGEMAQMLGIRRAEVEEDPLDAGRRAARRFQAVVVVKGQHSQVVTPQGAALMVEGGGVGLATSGSGDVLAGAITGLLARGAPPLVAAGWGVWLHAQAGRALGPPGFLARELPGQFPALLAAAG